MRVGQATARAALAGNPSDLHGGAVVAIPVPALTATVTLGVAGDGPVPSLVRAALARVGMRDEPCDWHTTIPRSVGLAGSSALVIAALRASGQAPADPIALADTALAIERDDLGITAGLQDRAVQAFEAPVLVDLGSDRRVRALSPAVALEFVVAWRSSAAGDSGDYHAGRTVDSAATKELARVARGAAAAFEAGDAAALANLMALSAQVRRDAAPLSSEHEQLADALLRIGLLPNSAGSGGAVVAVITGRTRIEDLPRELAAIRAEFLRVVCSPN